MAFTRLTACRSSSITSTFAGIFFARLPSAIKSKRTISWTSCCRSIGLVSTSPSATATGGASGAASTTNGMSRVRGSLRNSRIIAGAPLGGSWASIRIASGCMCVAFSRARGVLST